MKCPICDTPQIHTQFTKRVLDKYDATYLRCEKCGFMWVDNPFWLSEAYARPLPKAGESQVMGNIVFVPIVENVIGRYVPRDGIFLDYGGGCGFFGRLMRERGFNFYHYDAYCPNILMEGYDVVDLPSQKEFSLITAFEVFEHFSHPMKDIEKVLSYGNSVLFSTRLQPKVPDTNWSYLSPREGQHISFYTERSLRKIAEIFGLKYYTAYGIMHLLTPLDLPRNPFILPPIARMRRKLALMLNPAKQGIPTF